MSEPKVQTKEVRLIGGPMGGRMVTLPRSAEEMIVGKPGVQFWRYTYAGKEGRQELFAIVPASRAMQRFVHYLIAKTGKDPRVEQAQAPQPIRGRNSTRGQGARLRKSGARRLVKTPA